MQTSWHERGREKIMMANKIYFELQNSFQEKEKLEIKCFICQHFITLSRKLLPSKAITKKIIRSAHRLQSR